MMEQEGIHLVHKFSGRNWNNKKSTDKDITISTTCAVCDRI